MSLYKQVKMLVTLDITLVVFVVWAAVTNLLFKNIANYKLFFLSLTAVFLMQYIYIKKKNKCLAILLPLALSILFIFALFDGITILFNSIFLIVAIYINFALEEMPVNYEEYKIKSKQGALILALIAVLSLALEESAAAYLYRFFINYMIVTVILLRDSRAYHYKVSVEHNGNDHVLKRVYVNIFLKYCLVIVSTIMLTTDWILNKSLNLLNILNKGADIIISSLLELVLKIIGSVLTIVIHFLQRFLTNSLFLSGMNDTSRKLINIKKSKVIEKGGTLSDKIFAYTIFKIIILFIIVLLALDIIGKMKFLKHKSEQYVEDKEKIDKDTGNHNGKSRKRTIASILKRVFRVNITLKERILNVYWNFEKITEKARIYKPCMTATELKEKTKLSLKNDEYLDVMTDIYNEVKFSNLEPKENQLDIVKKAVDNAKKQL